MQTSMLHFLTDFNCLAFSTVRESDLQMKKEIFGRVELKIQLLFASELPRVINRTKPLTTS